VRALVAAGIVCSSLALHVAPAAAGAHLTGGGSGFAGPEIDQWRAETAVQPYNLSINYVAQGSTFGRTSFESKTLDFGASDITYPPLEIPDLQSSPRCSGKALHDCFVYVPVSAGGVAFMYNLTDASGNRITNLALTRRAACKIFTGAITKWNDPELVATNPFLQSYNRPIQPVVRADGAGESYVLSQFCIAVAPDVWRTFINVQRQSSQGSPLPTDFASGQPVSNWPVPGNGTSLAYADGVANAVASNEFQGAITYVAAAYAKQRNFPTASLQNAAGVFTQPDENNVTVALGYAHANTTADAAGTFDLNFTGADPRAYFPSTYSYVLAQRSGGDPSQGATLGQFLCYAISKGQEDAVPLRYARLSAPVVQIALSAITAIPGAPDAGHCIVAGSPPPPPPPIVTPGSSTPTGPNGPTTGPGSNNNTAAGLNARNGKNGNLSTAAGKNGRKGGRNSAVNGVYGASDTTSPANLDQELASARTGSDSGGKGVSGVWVLLAGVVITWGFVFLLSRRRNTA
jgi:ABC-type phosphate transport system substrate-binding protein